MFFTLLIASASILLNSFVPNAPFLYPLKLSENRKIISCFQGVEKGCIGNEWVTSFGQSYGQPKLVGHVPLL